MSNLPASANRIVGRNSKWLLLGELISRGLSFLIVIGLINYLGDTAYGEFAYALAAANILVVIADFGLSTYVTREVARVPEEANRYFRRLFGLKLALSTLALIAMGMAGLLLPAINLPLVLLGGLAIVMSSGRIYIEAFFRAYQLMHFETITKIVASIFLTITLGYGIWTHVTIIEIAALYALASTASVLVAAALFWYVSLQQRRQHSTEQSNSLTAPLALSTILVGAFPFAASLVFNYIFNYLDSVMLGAFNLTTANGWYSAAYKPIFFITALAGMIISAFFPAIARAWQQNKSEVMPYVEQLYRLNMLIILPIAVGGTVIAADIISLLFPADFAPATLAFQLLLWSTATIYFWATFGNSLQACNGERTYMKGFAIAAVLNIGLNSVLIPWLSLYGAALATWITQLFLAGFMYYAFKNAMGKPSFMGYIWRPFGAAIVMGCIVRYAQPHIDGTVTIRIVLSIGLGVMSYLIAAILMKAITKREFDFILTKSNTL